MAIRRHAQRKHFHFYSRCSSWTYRAERRRETDQLARGALGSRRRRCDPDGAGRHRDPGLGNATRQTRARRTDTMALAVPRLSPGTEADPSIGAYGIGANDEPDWHRVRVRAGQSLADIFHENGLSPADLQRALNSQDDASALRHIHPGDEFAFVTDANGALTLMRFDRGDAARVTLRSRPTASPNRSTSARRASQADRPRRPHGSLYGAASQAGMSNTMI